ncbi:MAG: hypothetical protein KGQ59_12565, partial [Bdellovibrionales bacterium]|nr:hypothetical protein [Bdellovibrionales bacterium]
KVFEIPQNLPPGHGIEPVSLMSHSMCSVSADSLQKTINKNVDDETVALAAAFAAKVNRALETSAQSMVPAVRRDSKNEVLKIYGRLAGCLAYVESLTTADSQVSARIAEEVAPVDYLKPPGVLFYRDEAQTDPDSYLNLGLYQFSPVSSGNIQSCIQNWNVRQSTDFINPFGGFNEMLRRLGNPSQDFNAFCGINKILQSFFVQVNTTSPKRTHPDNVKAFTENRLGLKAPSERCVTLHFDRKSYNHFGPFQNSTGKNLKRLLQCTLEAERVQSR